ncbi:MAG: UDP-N-acetylmuramoyl-L-alanyl-D-glutamate--2,6-diaminopimelate ligase [Deltaproteobacteria bacterium]|nr:UDP-N-acetylmuramoyl-L-alanyl-D-glutamate--2,6-diaminopimelate ligase [Deltaproteobacteria bacterium]
MQLSNLLKTVHPVKFHGIRAKPSEANTDTRNTERHEPDTSSLSLSPDPEIGSIHFRSQDVEPGGLFVAIKGLVADGHDFIDDALSRGATAIVAQKPVNREFVIIEVENTRRALATISGRFYSNPSEKLFLIGITGTNGKTTTAFLIEQILSQAGINVGVIGTLNYRYSGKTFQNPITTPESLDLQKILAQMVEEGITHVVLEVSSHALDLDRVFNCKFDLAVFTNLTQDHLDYHKDMESYWSCKKRLFTEILGPKSGNDRAMAVINHNDEKGRKLIHMLEARSGEISVLSAGFSDETNIWAERFDHNLTGISGRISTPEGFFEIKSCLVGQHNLENILCATGVGIALGVSLDIIKDGIESVGVVPGRLETIPNDHNRFVYVDYAHTPDALEHVLFALRSSVPGRLICVFGCGGNRDRAKRPQMGEIAGRFSDLVIVTSDNPRTEPPMEIIDEILTGTKKLPLHIYIPSDLNEGFQKKGCVVEPDRRNAIQLAMMASMPEDTVLIAGKGNETYQIIGDQTLSFDDRVEAAKALSMIGGPGSAPKSQGCSEPQTANPKSASLTPIPWTAAEILEATGGELFCGDSNATFAGVSIDSRRISVEDFFVAIKGDVHDGHSFIEDVMKKGVGGLLVEKNRTHKLPELRSLTPGITCITVNNTGKALGDLAAFNRKRTHVSVIAITGSNGKTSTRNMTTGVVSRRFCTLSTQGNLNNEIGLPLTLLNLNRHHRWAVLELGMNRPGEIERLAQICLPDLGVITNIGPAHLEGLGSLDAVMHAKGELLGKIKPGGTAVLNADDSRLLKLADTTSINVLLFGVSADAAIRAESITKKKSGLSFVLVLPRERIWVDLKTPAVFMISNALAAAAAGHLLGLTAGEIKEGLEDFKPVPGRMNILKTGKGVQIIDDTYNANPGSMEVAIKTLKSLKGQGRGILILGDMLELGEHAESLHREMGSKAAGSGMERIYVTGDYAENVVTGALEEHMDSSAIFKGTREEILEDIIGRLDAGDWILVKGSRGMAMEKVVEGLLRWAGNEN